MAREVVLVKGEGGVVLKENDATYVSGSILLSLDSYNFLHSQYFSSKA